MTRARVSLPSGSSRVTVALPARSIVPGVLVGEACRRSAVRNRNERMRSSSTQQWRVPCWLFFVALIKTALVFSGCRQTAARLRFFKTICCASFASRHACGTGNSPTILPNRVTENDGLITVTYQLFTTSSHGQLTCHSCCMLLTFTAAETRAHGNGAFMCPIGIPTNYETHRQLLC